jgi:hypothetical protein
MTVKIHTVVLNPEDGGNGGMYLREYTASQPKRQHEIIGIWVMTILPQLRSTVCGYVSFSSHFTHHLK